MFIPREAVGTVPTQEYNDPRLQAQFEAQNEYAAGLAHNYQPGIVNVLAPIPFSGQIPTPPAINWSANFISPPQSTDHNPPYATPKGSTIFAWIVAAAKALPITPSDAGS